MAVKLSGAAVLLLVVVPLCIYTCALLVGVHLGRALERRPDSVSNNRGILRFVAKGIWDAALGRDEDRTKHPDTQWIVATLEKRSATPMAQRCNRKPDSPRGVISVGPWGGSGGQPFYMQGPSAPRLRRIILITVYHSPGAIHSLACDYSLAGDGGPSRRAGPWGRPNSFGSSGLLRATVELSAGEHVTAVEGTTGHFSTVPGEVVTSLMFRTSRGRTYGPYGGGGNRPGRGTTAFSVPVADGACIAGFWGRSGWLLDAVGGI
ncbi:hypothetical protein BS78_08G013800 [Paspalum vaginatum]|nr:hypothetical protein BS78_08G013800 [Paspalum vaginatum]